MIQAYSKLIELNSDYYFFVADDILLNKDINEDNVLSTLKLGGSKKAYLYDIKPLNDDGNISWLWTYNSSQPFFIPHLNWRELLPPFDDAIHKFNDFFGKEYPLTYGENFFTVDPMLPEYVEKAKYLIAENGNTLNIPYPMSKGYSDIFCINKDDLHRFSRLNGILSAMNMFVEIAIPTAAVLTWNRDEINIQDDLPTKGIIESVYATDVCGETCDWKISELLNAMDEETLFIHPIKLSKWNIQ